MNAEFESSIIKRLVTLLNQTQCFLNTKKLLIEFLQQMQKEIKIMWVSKCEHSKNNWRLPAFVYVHDVEVPASRDSLCMCWLRLDGRVISAAGVQRTATPCLTSSLHLSLSVPVSLCPCLTSSRCLSLSLCIAPHSAWMREWGWWVCCIESEYFFTLQLYFNSAVLMVWLG